MQKPRAIVTIAAAALGAGAIALVAVQKHNAEWAVNQSISGELVAYEVSSRDLTLRTEDGDRHFVVQDGIPLHEGARTITLANLISASGCPAKVWYRDAEGRWIASEVRISCAGTLSPEAPSSTQPGRR